MKQIIFFTDHDRINGLKRHLLNIDSNYPESDHQGKADVIAALNRNINRLQNNLDAIPTIH